MKSLSAEMNEACISSSFPVQIQMFFAELRSIRKPQLSPARFDLAQMQACRSKGLGFNLLVVITHRLRVVVLVGSRLHDLIPTLLVLIVGQNSVVGGCLTCLRRWKEYQLVL